MCVCVCALYILRQLSQVRLSSSIIQTSPQSHVHVSGPPLPLAAALFSQPSMTTTTSNSTSISFIPLSTALRVGMNTKKVHEVGVMASFLKHMADACGTKSVVDFGSGE